MADEKAGLPWKALHTFVILASSERYSDAAQRIGVSVSAVSHQIRSLEAWIGRDLLDRATKRPALTETGKALFHGVAESIDQISQVTSSLQRRAGTDVVVISAPPAFASFRLVPTLSEFWSEHPKIDVDFRFSKFDADIDFEKVDLAIRFLHESEKAARLGDRGWSAFASPSYSREIGNPSVLGELERGILLHEEIYNFWPDVYSEARLSPPSKTKYQGVGEAHHVLSALISGHGLALLPNELANGLLRTGGLVKLFDVPIEPNAAYFALTPPDRPLSEPTSTLLNWLQRWM